LLAFAPQRRQGWEQRQKGESSGALADDAYFPMHVLQMLQKMEEGVRVPEDNR
jgi:hypothetical protein